MNGNTAAVGGSGGAGIDYGNFPIPRGLNFGLRLGYDHGTFEDERKSRTAFSCGSCAARERLPELPRRKYQSERAADGYGESVSAADAALDGDGAAVRRPLRRTLHAGVDAARHLAQHLGPDGLRSGERQRRGAVARRVLVAGPEPHRHEHQGRGRAALGSPWCRADSEGVGLAGAHRSSWRDHRQGSDRSRPGSAFDYDTQEYAYQEVQRLLDSAIVLLQRTDGPSTRRISPGPTRSTTAIAPSG